MDRNGPCKSRWLGDFVDRCSDIAIAAAPGGAGPGVPTGRRWGWRCLEVCLWGAGSRIISLFPLCQVVNFYSTVNAYMFVTA